MSQDKKADELHVSSSRDSRVCRIYRQYSQTREIDFKLRRRAVNDIMIYARYEHGDRIVIQKYIHVNGYTT